jgi:endogenous inhibitor of DNA gyrase (YacG/DUF329 family)
MKCPICRKEVEAGSKYAPFCSDRCRLIDLGNWATGQYRIAGPAQSESEREIDRREREKRGE